ncbi:MAG: ATP-binding protein [Desulfobacteraceae bacterium]|nr:MAG: ATP-binding protein [Desulfobacteraceae bacterium]
MESLRLPAKLEHLESLISFAVQEAERMKLSEEEVFSVKLALEELLVNSISYAYPSGQGEIEIACFSADEGAFSVLVRDWGPPFNPLEMDEPDLSQGISEKRVGGLGIYLVRQMTKELTYRREGDANVLTLRFT